MAAGSRAQCLDMTAGYRAFGLYGLRGVSGAPHKDGRQRVAFQIQQTLREHEGSSLSEKFEASQQSCSGLEAHLKLVVKLAVTH